MLKLNSGMKKHLIAVVALVLAVGMLLSLTGCSVVNKLTAKYLDNGPKYFALVEEKAVSEFCSTFSTYYGHYLKDGMSRDSQYNVKLNLLLGDAAMEGLKQSLGGQLDVGWLSDTDLDLTFSNVGGNVSADLLFGIGGQHVLTVNSAYDLASGSILLGLREMTDDVLKFGSGSTDLSAVSGNEKQLAAQALPTAEVVTRLIEKYHGMIISNITNIEKTTEDFTVDDLTQSLTMLKCTIDRTTAKAIALEILNDMKTDGDVKAIIENLQTLTDGAENTDAYADFLAELDEQIAEVNAQEDSEEAAVILYDYVDSSDRIVGRRIEQDGTAVLSYITVEQDGQFVIKANLPDGYAISESGTRKGDLITSDRYYSENGQTVLRIGFTDFDTKAFKSGTISGKFRFYPNEEALEEAASDSLGDAAALLNAAFELELQGNRDAGTFNLTVFNGDAEVFSAKNASYAISDAPAYAEPSGKQITVDGLDALEEVAAGLHLDQLVENLRNTPIPQDYVDTLEELSNQLKENY